MLIFHVKIFLPALEILPQAIIGLTGSGLPLTKLSNFVSTRPKYHTKINF